MTGTRRRRFLREILLVAVFCLAYTLIRTLTAQGFLYYVRRAPMPFARIFPGELLTHCLWGIFFFLIRAMVHVFRDRIRGGSRRLAAHALMYLFTPLLLRTISLWLYGALDLWKSIPGNIQGARLLGVAFSRWLFYDYVLYALILGLILFFDAFKRRKQYQIARLRTELRQVTFRSLSEELRPQFVLSIFDRLERLIERDPDRAGRMVSRFCEWLRALQNAATRPLIPLEEELRFFNSYLEIERLCRGSGLAADVRLPREALSWPVPPLILQPLVEARLNRLPCAADLAVAVSVAGRIEPDGVRITVELGLPGQPGEEAASADGWSQPLRAKLAAAYGEEATLCIRRESAGETAIELYLPHREPLGQEPAGGSACAS